MDAVVTQKEQQLNSALHSMRYWDRQAGLESELAEQMRRIAHELDASAAPLDHVLAPIRDLHTPQTWDGNAATQSRRRLDAHEDRCATAIRAVHYVIDDLQTQAQAASRRAQDAWENHRSYQRTASRIEVELDTHDSLFR